jgi:hypothetical protein
VDWYVSRELFFSIKGEFTRSGENVYDSLGTLVRNVGGDVLQPHRPADPQERVFLDGRRVNMTRIESLVSYEVTNQTWLEGWYLFEDTEPEGANREVNHTAGVRVRLLF